MTEKSNAISDAGTFTINRKKAEQRHPTAYVVADRMVHVTVWAGGGWRTASTGIGDTPAKLIAGMMAKELVRKFASP